MSNERGSAAETKAPAATGPLHGLRVIELAGIGPAQLGAMVLSDLGAEVIKIDRPSQVVERPAGPNPELLNRGRRSIAIDLKDERGCEVFRTLLADVDVLVDPYRPGVLERLGLAPAALVEEVPHLVVVRMTGWGRTGPLAHTAGHDINYLGVVGGLWPIGGASTPPPPPLNLVGDFGGGAMLMVVGILAALHERAGSGRGQIVDAAMVDGVATLLTSIFQLSACDLWREHREANWLQGAAPWYRSYAAADDEYITVGPLEAKFYRVLLDALDLDPEEWPQWDEDLWPQLTEQMAAVFATRSASEWRDLLEGTDACFGQVLRPRDAASHPHLAARETYVDYQGFVQPAPSPRFDRTPGSIASPPPWRGEHTRSILAGIGLSDEVIASLFAASIVAEPSTKEERS